MKKPVKPVMLLADKGSITMGCLCTSVRYGDKPLIFGEFENSRPKECKVQYVYVTVSQDVETIKVGDTWCINLAHKMLVQPTDAEWAKSNADNLRVVIATNDPKLTVIDFNRATGSKFQETPFKNLPQVQQSFLKEYVANPDGKWEVEYEEIQKTKVFDNGMQERSERTKVLELKINKDNTVNITSLEKKMYSRKQMLDYSYWRYTDRKINGGQEKDALERWIKENL